jgi:hypothetical protein
MSGGHREPKATTKGSNTMKKFPKYIKSYDGYIGVFRYLDFDGDPVYRFEGGERTADRWEIEHGSDSREELLK